MEEHRRGHTVGDRTRRPFARRRTDRIGRGGNMSKEAHGIRFHRDLKRVALVALSLIIPAGVANAQVIPAGCNRVCLNSPSLGANPMVMLNGESSTFDF